MDSSINNFDGNRLSLSSEAISTIQFGPDGCKARENGEKCGETETLSIINDFNQLYEEKISQIDEITGGDNAEVSWKYFINPDHNKRNNYHVHGCGNFKFTNQRQFQISGEDKVTKRMD